LTLMYSVCVTGQIKLPTSATLLCRLAFIFKFWVYPQEWGKSDIDHLNLPVLYLFPLKSINLSEEKAQ